MDHSTFIEKYRANEIAVSVDKNKAGFMYANPSLMPHRLRKRQALIRTVAFGIELTGITLFFFAPWWVALLIIFLGLFMFPYAQKSAARGVLEACLEDPYVYQTAIDNQVVIVEEIA